MITLSLVFISSHLTDPFHFNIFIFHNLINQSFSNKFESHTTIFLFYHYSQLIEILID